MSNFINISNLTFSYPSSSQILFDSVSLQIHHGWTAIVGANGCGKSTFLKLAGGLLEPESGSISVPESFYYCEQRTDTIPPEFIKFLSSFENTAYKLKETLQIKDDWIERWPTLSHGERKRCQVATALSLNPEVLAVDEPTNHLDVDSKIILFNALRSFKGIGLLVSHDRELLDSLCSNTIFIQRHTIDIRRSNYSSALIEIERENNSRLNEFNLIDKEIKKLKTEAILQKQKADGADKMRSKRNIAPGDRDAKAKIDLARLTSKDALAGRLYKKLKTELDRKTERQQTINYYSSYSSGIEFDAGKMKKFYPINVNSSTLYIGKDKELYFPDLLIEAGVKIGITGRNGSGKSTFIRALVQKLNYLKQELIYIPQEIENSEVKELLMRILDLSGKEKGRIMNIISRLNSDPKHLLETENPSPGEVRKLILAEGILRSPVLIIMDEPTNHMDLPSIKCLEEALIECGCSVILVSHDIVFLKNIVSEFWNFEEDDRGYKLRIVGPEYI